MNSLDEDLKQVAVIGAAGKMGVGITLLLLTAMAELGLQTGADDFSLKAIDPNEQGLKDLKSYLRKQLTRWAEKNINKLRRGFAKKPHLVSNEEMIEAFLGSTFENIDFGTSLEEAKNSTLIFEAAIEDVEKKAAIYKALGTSKAFFFTNTSSIPLELLSERGDVKGRLIGFHFYNPPAVQKLVELIVPASINPELSEKAGQLVKRLNKLPVYSADVAGFIGNGYFIRELKFACDLVRTLAKESSLEIAIQQVNTITKDFLLRPMGIFQLLDYVGVDVAKNIFTIMREYLPDPSLKEPLIEDWGSHQVIGGQRADGSQKDGIFNYSSSIPIAVFSISKKGYIPLNQDLSLGMPPLGYSWKALQKDPQRQEKIKAYFAVLAQEKSLGSKLTLSYLEKGAAIAKQLVADGIAQSLDDVSVVLKNGFFHLYGPHEVEAICG